MFRKNKVLKSDIFCLFLKILIGCSVVFIKAWYKGLWLNKGKVLLNYDGKNSELFVFMKYFSRRNLLDSGIH